MIGNSQPFDYFSIEASRFLGNVFIRMEISRSIQRVVFSIIKNKKNILNNLFTLIGHYFVSCSYKNY